MDESQLNSSRVLAPTAGFRCLSAAIALNAQRLLAVSLKSDSVLISSNPNSQLLANLGELQDVSGPNLVGERLPEFLTVPLR